MAANKVLETIGTSANHEPEYVSSDWQQRDNFEDIEGARAYATWKSEQYPITPYRIRQLRGRFAVEFVPEWKLQS